MKPTNILRLQTISIICILLVIFHSCDGDEEDSPSTNNKVYTDKIKPIERSYPPSTDDTDIATTNKVYTEKVNPIRNSSSTNEKVYTDKINPINYNEYREVTICGKTWMAYNLSVDTYRNGEPIPEVENPVEWAKLTTGAWCYYGGDPANERVYGKLYNWYAVTDLRGFGPHGWHVPTIQELYAFEICFGGTQHAGRKLKEAGTRHWKSPNDANDSTRFTALPGGWRDEFGSFRNKGERGYYWSRDKVFPQGLGYTLALFNDKASSQVEYRLEKSGFSVRLVKDLK